MLYTLLETYRKLIFSKICLVQAKDEGMYEIIYCPFNIWTVY